MPLGAVAAISAAILAFEVLLTRVLAIVHWHHFAPMVISVALLGYAASGSAVYLLRDRLRPRLPAAFAACAALFALTALGGVVLGQRVPFNALEVAWNPGQLLHLWALYACFFLPFLFGAACIALALSLAAQSVGRIYAADLLGAGAGGAGVVAALALVAPGDVLRVVAVVGLAAAMLAHPRPVALAALGALVAAVVLLPARITDLAPSPYKGLSLALLLPGAHVVAERSGPRALLSAVASPEVPLRHVPGLSLANPQEPAAQIGVFVDADALTPITAFDGREQPLAYLDRTLAALPYALVERPSVLVLGAGGGTDVLQALTHGARRVDAVAADPNLVELVAERFATFAGGLYQRDDVVLHVAEPRRFLAAARQRWDVVQLSAYDRAATGLAEDYLLTVEAVRELHGHLADGGVAAIAWRLELPPRQSGRLFATVLEGLRAAGLDAPADHLALLRNWDALLLLIAREPLEGGRLAAIRRFAAERAFDLAWLPGLDVADTNRFHLLERPILFETAAALAGPGAADFVRRYKFDIRPATDDRPYVWDSFRWRALPELWQRRTEGGAVMLDWGYLVHLAALVQAGLLGVVLVLLPLGLRGTATAGAAAVGGYFAAIGLAFLFVELAFLARFTLLLGHPTLAFAAVLAAFLVFAGLGARSSAALATRLGAAPAAALAALGIGGLGLAYALLWTRLFELASVASLPLRLAIGVGLIAPLAFLMGLPLPLGLARLRAAAPPLVPWAFGVNGLASVLSALLAGLIAAALGLTALVVLAAALYGMAAGLFRRLPGAG